MPESANPHILHIEACNFVDRPMGGQLSFSRQLIKTFGSRLALAGWAISPQDPIGCWFQKDIEGTVHPYFAFSRGTRSDRKPFIPARLNTWLEIRRYWRAILALGIPNIIISEHAILLAMGPAPCCSVCYRFPGVASPLSISRYRWAALFSDLFDRLFRHALRRKVSCILAAADKAAIAEYQRKTGIFLRDNPIHPYPTRVDTGIFRPEDCQEARRRVGLPRRAHIAVTTGRIHWAKGWSFLLDSFQCFRHRHPDAMLIFLGDGAEREALEKKAADLGLQEHVIVVGYQPSTIVASYLQSADLFVMGSHKEGWSTALLEALACHLPIVTTRFSSADTIVRHGINGFIADRNPAVFSHAMESALSLSDVADYAGRVIDRYALKNLERDLAAVWPMSRPAANVQNVAG